MSFSFSVRPCCFFHRIVAIIIMHVTLLLPPQNIYCLAFFSSYLPLNFSLERKSSYKAKGEKIHLHRKFTLLDDYFTQWAGMEMGSNKIRTFLGRCVVKEVFFARFFSQFFNGISAVACIICVGLVVKERNCDAGSVLILLHRKKSAN